MSAYGLHPTFTDLAGYRAWRATWRKLHGSLEARRATQAQTSDDLEVMIEKSRTLLRTAQERMERIRDMHRQMAEQEALFPLTLEAPAIDFHFNKGSLEFPFLPAWVLKAKGRTYYVSNVEFDCVGTTRETPDHASTKGSMRFRQACLHIERGGQARITRRAQVALSQAA
jgi:uncharacterized coiled-coil protein SlyX